MSPIDKKDFFENANHETVVKPEKAGEVAAELAVEANPKLSPEVQKMIKEDINDRVRENFQEIKLGLKKIGDPDACGLIKEVFKDEADKQYGAIALAFDKQGNVIVGNGHDKNALVSVAAAPGTKVSEGVVGELKKMDPRAAPQLQEGYRVTGMMGIAGPSPGPK
jgi:hypothetical protein